MQLGELTLHSLDLKDAQACDGAHLSRGRAIEFATPPGRWHYALALSCSPAVEAPFVVEIDAETVRGEVGFGCVNDGLSSYVSSEEFLSERDGRAILHLLVEDASGKTIIARNASKAGPSRCRIFRCSLIPAAALSSRESQAIKARQLANLSEDDIRKAIKAYDKEAIKAAFASDPYTRNYVLNIWECENQVERLESYPWNIAIPVADICNARCTFCASWLMGKSVMKPAQLKPYLEILPYARLIGLQGHGEPLANPHIGEILDMIAGAVDRRAEGYLITNGVFLRKHLKALLRSRISTFNISLNATTPETHNVVMGLGPNALPPILETIRELVTLRESTQPEIRVNISMVLTADNIQEAADFVRFGNDERVDAIYLRTLMPLRPTYIDGDLIYPEMGLNYHLLPPLLHPTYELHAQRAREAMATSSVKIEAQPETWGADALSPETRELVTKKPPRTVPRDEALADADLRAEHQKNARARLSADQRGMFIEEIFDLEHNPYDRKAPFPCRFVYQNLITTQLTLVVYPCCYMDLIPGHTTLVLRHDQPFMSVWNSDALVNLRRRLRQGPLFQACATCPMQG